MIKGPRFHIDPSFHAYREPRPEPVEPKDEGPSWVLIVLIMLLGFIFGLFGF